tara:strand:- start:97 stop:657 length:561 start_codon:yes stop_codon:yes gene_type:complete
MNFFEKAQNVFYVQEVLSYENFCRLEDEFNPAYNNWAFKKSESHGESPLFGHLVDSRGGLSLGANHQIIKLGTTVHMLCKKILRKNLELVRINSNIQFFGQESNFHVDSSPEMRWWTFVLFANRSWSTEWGGQLVIQTAASQYIGLPYVPNCGALFDGSVPHKGESPNRFCLSERKSVAFSFAEQR